MKIKDLIGVLSKLDLDLDITVAGVDFVVIRERTGGYTGHVPPQLTRWIEINSPDDLPDLGTMIPELGTLENYRERFTDKE